MSVRPSVHKKFQGHSSEVDRQSPTGLIFRLDALALSVIATATWLGGWVAGWVAGWLASCHTPVLYQNP